MHAVVNYVLLTTLTLTVITTCAEVGVINFTSFLLHLDFAGVLKKPTELVA